MPSTFPPPSVERHHSRRRSGRHDDPEAQVGSYANSRPTSGHRGEALTQPSHTYQPRSSHDNPQARHQNSHYQTTSPVDTHQNPSTNAPQLSYNPNRDSAQPYHDDNPYHQNDGNGSSYPPGGPTASTSHPRTTATYQPPTNHSDHEHDEPHQGPYDQPQRQPHSRSRTRSGGGLLPSFFSRRGARTDGNSSATGNRQAHRPSPLLTSKRRGGRWEDVRGHLVATSGEFVGTIFFLWFSLSAAQVSAMTNPAPDGAQTPQTILFIALAFGFSLAVNAWAFYRISGGLFNPAVVLGMCVSGSLPWVRGACLVPTQIVASMIAAALVQAMFPGDVGVVLTKLAPGVSIAQGLFIEMFLTALLVFTILMLAAEKHQATFLAPVGIGLSLFVAELSGVYFTGGSLNPARSFGPSVAARSFPGYHWIYWLGPAMGALLAAAYYKLVKYLNYEEANPGQDAKHE